MNSPSVSVQPTAAPRMQMTIEQAQASERQESENLASRTRGGGAAKACLIGALSCFLCCEVARARSAALAVADQMS
ncbi:unnamed protein product [Rhizoctonia solani]|uniref:Uncharacterized protein n=1 Tax=Rhizoctonia solani TaxID=456999 RepID=A0A8H3BPD3_9AGAM|nr:unnamed protein product [Rhizoctonia solani]